MAVEIKQFKHETFIFPGGEVSVKIDPLPILNVSVVPPRSMIDITARLANSNDIMELLLVCDAIRRRGYKNLDLTIPYVPYARQDRVCNFGEAHSIKVMADLINSIDAVRVTIHDPHSDVTSALINNVNIVEQHTLVKQSPEILNTILDEDDPKTVRPDPKMEPKIIVCPDAGAEKKIQKLKRPYILATKVRDPATGEIKRTKIYDAHMYSSDDKFIIVDDICDGGRTFIEIAKALKEHNAQFIDLYVTHGIFSKGFKVFDGLIDRIYYYDMGKLTCQNCTTDSSSSNIASTG